MANEFRTDITADPTQFNAAMDAMGQKAMSESQRIQSAMREAFGQINNSAKQMHVEMKSSLDGLVAGFAKVQSVMIGVGAAIAGGSVFGVAVNKSAELTKESMKLARTLGISATEASVLAVALGDIYQNSDTLIAANTALTRTLREDEAAVKGLGVATRDGNGNFRNSLDIMLDVNKRLADFKEGTDQNIEGQKIYKKSWGEVAPLIKLNADLMEDAKKKAEALGLVVGAENVEATTRYRAAMNNVKDVMDAVQKTIGDAVMPVLTELGEWFAGTGPQRVEVMRKVMAGVVAMFYGLKMAAEIVWGFIKLWVENIVINFLRMAEVAEKALSLDFQGAKAAWQRGGEQLVDTFDAAMEKIVEKARGNNEAIMAALYRGFEGPGVTPTKRNTGAGDTSEGGANKSDKSRMSGWEAELAAQRDAYDKQKLEQGSFQQFTLAMERDYWRKILDTVAMTDDERAAALKKYYTVERELRKTAFEAEISELKERLERHKQGSIERIRLAGESAARIGEKYGLESKEYKQALGEMSKMAEERGKQRQQLEEMALERAKEEKIAVIELERQALDDAEKLGLIKTKDKLARLKELKETEFQIELQALQDMAAIYEMDAIAYQQHLDKLAKLKEKHAVEVRKLDGQVAADSKKSFDTWFDPIGNGFQKLMDGMIQGTQTWSQAIRKTLLAVGAEYLSAGVKIAVAWVKTELMKTQATVAGVATRGAAEKAGAAESVLVSAWTAIKTIGIKAWEAAASVYAAISNIPIVGPFLAPAMAVAAAGTVMSFVGRIASAEGGFDIPRGLNPVTQLHENEMVLPAHLADVVRRMAGDGGGGKGGGDTNIHLNVQAWYSRDVRNFLLDNKAKLADALKSAYRDGKR